MGGVARFFAVVAACGFVASLVVHLIAWTGLEPPFGEAVFVLHAGIFVVWLPAVLMTQKLVRGAPRRDFWKAALRGCPQWMRTGLYILFPYVFVNFFAGMLLGVEEQGTPYRMFSGHWLLFYFAGMAMLTSAANLNSRGPRKCANGHGAPPFSRFCSECGSELPPDPIV